MRGALILLAFGLIVCAGLLLMVDQLATALNATATANAR